MSRAVAFSLAVICRVAVFSQFPSLPVDSLVDQPGRWANRISAEGSFAYNANSLYNELPWALYQGGFIDRDLRQRSMDAVASKQRNTAGHIITARVTWTGRDCFLDHRHWRPLVSVAHHEQVGLRFTDDLYEVTFFGNAGFEGERADLGPSANTQIRYQTIGAGIQDDRSGSYARLDLVNGQSISAADVEWAGVYTGTDGRVLRASILGDFYQSDTAGSDFGRSNGIGLALSGRWATVLRRTHRPIDLAFEVQDLGFTSWNGNAVRIEKDTVIEYEGFEVANIFDLDEVLLGEQQLRDTFGLQYRTGAFTRLLPFMASASASMKLGRNWRGTAILDQRYLPGYVPQVTVTGSRRCGSHALLGASLSYGGFGGLRIGLASRFRIAQRVLVSVGTPHVPGFFLGTTRGAGISFGVSVGF
ncbi:MAG: DUF5723 family protein [Flavobacteriales bacterium]